MVPDSRIEPRTVLRGMLFLVVGGFLLTRAWFCFDWVGLLAVLAFIGVCVAAFATFDSNMKAQLSDGGYVLVRWMLDISLVALLLSLFVMGSGALGGVWVDLDSGQTTVTRNFIFTNVLKHEFRYVWDNFHDNGGVQVRTNEGLPVSCTIYVNGASLDYRDPAVLEKKLLAAAAATGDPNTWIASQLTSAVNYAALAVLSSRSNEELERSGHFDVEYKIGSPLVAALSSLGLQWRNGSVGYSCRLAPFNN